MGRLGSCMNDYRRFQFRKEAEDSVPISDVHRVMGVTVKFVPQPLKHPTCIALGTKKNGTLVVVHTSNAKAQSIKVETHF